MHNSYTHARKCYRVPFDHIADISEHRLRWRWCILSSRCTFKHRKSKILAYFGYFVAKFRTFWCTFTGRNNAVHCGGVPKTGMFDHGQYLGSSLFVIYICKSQLMAKVWRKIFWLVCFVSDRIGMKSTREAVKQEDRQELGQISEVVQAEMMCKISIYVARFQFSHSLAKT